MGFVLGKAKLAPSNGHTIHRLELCSAVLGIQTAKIVLDNIDTNLKTVQYYTDTKVVLGYIHNSKRRFYNYVSNRVDKIRKYSEPGQWKYVPSAENPADNGSRSVKADELQSSQWCVGPRFITQTSTDHEAKFTLIDPDSDPEIRKNVDVLKTDSNTSILGTKRFERYSTWTKLVETIARLQHIAKSFGGHTNCKGWHLCTEAKTVESFENAANVTLREVQQEAYHNELSCTSQNKAVPRNSSIISLNPVKMGYLGSVVVLLGPT
ncbi:uncharacterized protein LOC128558874 [Mercenaria mercenaria]|uniref:uncharacterized protein LOC128558874 n=1 Tax=Mercenaria mercenaria TaxID=6596 RepID=UPI00234EEC02|nr:uncharacterized protein LOC128558874 [Mercenaria mercenaria]